MKTWMKLAGVGLSGLMMTAFAYGLTPVTSQPAATTTTTQNLLAPATASNANTANKTTFNTASNNANAQLLVTPQSTQTSSTKSSTSNL